MKARTIVLADSMDDVVIITPRRLDAVRGVVGRDLLVAASAQGHPEFQRMMQAVAPCFLTVPEPHASDPGLTSDTD